MCNPPGADGPDGQIMPGFAWSAIGVPTGLWESCQALAGAEVNCKAYNNVERIEQQRLRMGAVMLEKIERDPSAFVDSYNLAVQKRIDRQRFTSAGDTGKLRCEKVTATRP